VALVANNLIVATSASTPLAYRLTRTSCDDRAFGDYPACSTRMSRSVPIYIP